MPLARRTQALRTHNPVRMASEWDTHSTPRTTWHRLHLVRENRPISRATTCHRQTQARRMPSMSRASTRTRARHTVPRVLTATSRALRTPVFSPTPSISRLSYQAPHRIPMALAEQRHAPRPLRRRSGDSMARPSVAKRVSLLHASICASAADMTFRRRISSHCIPQSGLRRDEWHVLKQARA